MFNHKSNIDTEYTKPKTLTNVQEAHSVFSNLSLKLEVFSYIKIEISSVTRLQFHCTRVEDRRGPGETIQDSSC